MFVKRDCRHLSMTILPSCATCAQMKDAPAQELPNRDVVAGLGKGLAIIELFNETRRRMAISEAAALTGLTRAAARRYLLSLVHLGYAEFDGKFFSLTPRVMRLGHAYLAMTPLAKLMQPFVESISRQIEDPATAAILDDTDVVYIARAAPPRIVSVSLGVGSRLPAYCTSLGRVLLAHAPAEWLESYWRRAVLEQKTPKTLHTRKAIEAALAEVRRLDYALIDEEVEVGLRSLAVPLRNTRGAVMAALTITVHSTRMTPAEMPDRLLPLMRTAQETMRQVP